MQAVPLDQIGLTPDGGCVDGISTWKNQFGFLSYDGRSYDGSCAFFQQERALTLGDGWFLVVGLGALFALLTAAMVWLEQRGSTPDDFKKTSEFFSTAGRDVALGLTATDVVSKWIWAASLLQSSNVAFKFGVSGPFWYAAGATIQILLFSVVAIEIKRKCPAIHTLLEVVNVRWGPIAHMVFLFFCLLANLIVSAMLILGGSSVVYALTGMNSTLTCFLMPLGVSTYTMFGGLKGTYYAAWTHTAVIYAALIVFVWKVFVGPSDIGSPDRMWENLQIAAQKNPVEGNDGGSLMTMVSGPGLIFGVVNIVGNFGTVFVDQSYWQGAISARPSASWRGYLIGGLAWFAVPFTLATTLGLAARALDLPVTSAEAADGLVPPAVALHLLGKSGAFLVALQVFLAVTATANSEQLAVATLLAYDVYKTRVNPNASGAQVVAVSRGAVLLWAVVSALAALALRALGLSLGWVYLAMGVMIGSAVPPICMSILWRECTGPAAIIAAVVGLIAAVSGWVGMAAQEEGGVSVDTLGKDIPMLTGNLLALLVSAVLAWALSTMSGGQKYEWAKLDELTRRNLLEHDDNAYFHYDDSPEPRKALEHAYSTAVKTSLALTFALIILWPLCSLPQNPFSQSYFRWWVLLAAAWGHIAAVVVIVLPLWELVSPRLRRKPPAQPESGESAEMERMPSDEGSGVCVSVQPQLVIPVSTAIHLNERASNASSEKAAAAPAESAPQTRQDQLEDRLAEALR